MTTETATTARELERAEREYCRAQDRAEHYRTRRNDIVRRALADGWTHQRISDVTGLSRGRVSQIKENT